MTQNNNEQEAQAKERKRVMALANLTGSLKDLALAYSVDSSEDFGKADNSVVETFKYFPAINSGTKYNDLESGIESDLIRNALLGSRKNNKRYTGSVSESQIIETASTIIDQSLGAVKASDALVLMGSSYKLPKNFADFYLSDMLSSNDAKYKEIAQAIMLTYKNYSVSNGVSEAHSQQAKAVRKGLESILQESLKEESSR